MCKRAAELLLLLLFVLLCAQVLAEGPDEGEDRGTIERLMAPVSVPTEIMMQAEIEEEKPKPVLPAEKVFIKEVRVTGVTLLPEKEIARIIGPFQNAKLSGKDMQRCADQITDVYSIKGYITSYAYVEPAFLSQGILEIKTVEGKVGEITVEGANHFSEAVYKKRIGVQEGDIFNFKVLKNNVYRTNKHPDRKVTPRVVPSGTPGVTDISLSAKDKLPLHVTFDIDNYGSHYILNNRNKCLFTSNNFTGHDDSLTIKVQVAQANAHKLYDLDYYIPLNNNWKWEIYLMPYKAEDYYHEREVIGMEKKAQKSYTYLYQTIIDEPDCSLVMNYGFVYKDIFWYAYGVRSKWDRFRALLGGFDFFLADKWGGKTVVTDDLEVGIPRMWGGNTAEDIRCSVIGAGGKYSKNLLTVARRQKLIYDSELVFKGRWQVSSTTLTGVNAFSMGGYYGVIDNRGYPRAQTWGDSGYSFHTGLVFPPYFIPKDMEVPFSAGKLYNSLQLFTFFDWAEGILKSPDRDMDEEKKTILRSAGFGFLLTLPESFSFRVDCGWPLDDKSPHDGDHFHTWWRVTKTF